MNLTLGLFALLAVALRWTGLGRESLWFDEGMTWWLSSLPPARMIEVIRGDVAAPVHFLLLHGWEKLFGDSDVSMRAVSALVATLAIVPFYLVARRVLRSRAAILAACAMMAISFMQVQYTKEARYYALLSLLANAALACVPAMAARWSAPAMVGFVACVAVGLYTHNMMMFCLAGLNVAWIAWPGERPLRRRLVDVVLANVLIVLLYLPWVPALLQQMKWMTGTFWAHRPGAFDLGVTAAAIAGVDAYAPPGYAWAWFGHAFLSAGGVATFAGVAIVVLCVLALATRDAAQRRAALALVAFALGPVLLVFVYSQVRQPIFMERVFIASSAALPILFALAIDRGRPLVVRLAGAVVLAGLLAMAIPSVHALLTTPRKEDWRGAYAAVAKLPPSDRRLVVFVANEGELPFAYYAAHDAARRPEPRTGAPGGYFDWDPPKTIRRVLTDADLWQLRQQMTSGQWDEIVLVVSHEWFADPQNLTERALRTNWRLEGTTTLRLVRVVRFAR